ncbi:MAG: hypothetical protein AMK72_13630 [Planctomycetes bacterium SM23_25]|nr:MAG: hypothetical protein AMK72_13630 [Planctomycetes bacterium SM23_25]
MAASVQRGVAMRGRKGVLIQDEVRADQPLDVLWGMVTRAKVRADGPRVVLEKRGKRLYGRILAPEGARFDTVGANPKPPERQQSDATKLVVRLPGKTGAVRVAVALAPEAAALGVAGAVTPLAEWPGRLK